MPGGPTTRRAEPSRRRARRHAQRSRWISRSRPTMGVVVSSALGTSEAAGSTCPSISKRAFRVSGSMPSSETRETETGSASPFISKTPCGCTVRPSTAPAPRTAPSLASTSPGPALLHRRAARFSTPPRYPPSTGTAGPESTPIPTRSGRAGCSSTSSAKMSCRSTAARSASAAEPKTASASSPRSSMTSPP